MAKAKTTSGWVLKHRDGLGFFGAHGRGRKAWTHDLEKVLVFEREEDAESFNTYLNGGRPGKHLPARRPAPEE